MDGNFGHFLEVARIQSEVNKLFDVLLETRGCEGEGVERWLPNIDICETDMLVIVRCEVPGVCREALQVAAQGGALVIAGRKDPSRLGDGIKFHCVERAHGEFRRIVHLPSQINTREARAILENGLLTIVFPKVSNRRGEEVQIPVQEAAVGTT